jgi:hypothetical protein
MATGTTKKPRVVRIWRGRVKRERAAEYQKYNYEFGIKALIEKAMRVQALREDIARMKLSLLRFCTGKAWRRCRASRAATQPRFITYREIRSS